MKVWLSFVPIDIIKWYFHIGIGKTLDSLGFWVGCPKKETSFSFTEANWQSQKFTDITIPVKGFLCFRVFSLVENKGCNLFYHLLNFHPLSLMRQHLHRNPLNLTRISFLSSQILFVLPMTKLSCLSIDKMEPWVHVICPAQNIPENVIFVIFFTFRIFNFCFFSQLRFKYLLQVNFFVFEHFP